VGIAADDIDRVRSAVSLRDVVAEHVELRRSGRQWAGCCPFHAERTPSFYVNEEKGLYHCHGCQRGGDVFRFVMELEHVDFATAVERLAGRAGITVTYTGAGENRDRSRRNALVAAVDAAVAWYHERLLHAPDAGAARGYLRSRGLGGDEVRRFRIGWAPDDWDALVRSLDLSADVLRDAGLGFVNQRGRMQDAFRARVLFPIHDERGDAVGFGGRILPGGSGPKYKNTAETRLYRKSKLLYGLHLAKDAAVAADAIIVCEGYTDVIGFHHVGLANAVATCGTALTGEHVASLRRFAKRVVLAFDADGAGQGATERFAQWESEHDLEVVVAQLPEGVDPADLARNDPEALRGAVTQAVPFVQFRLDRLWARTPMRTPEQKAKAADAALALVSEHPNADVRRLYASRVAAATGLPVAELAERAVRRRPAARPGPTRNPGAAAGIDGSATPDPSGPGLVEPAPVRGRGALERTVLWLCVHRFDDVVAWVHPCLFADPRHRAALAALAEADGDVGAAVGVADEITGALLAELATLELDADAARDVFLLVRAAGEAGLRRARDSGVGSAHGGSSGEPSSGHPVAPTSVSVIAAIKDLPDSARAADAARVVLGWLIDRAGGVAGGAHLAVQGELA
jgi:DNA primase